MTSNNVKISIITPTHNSQSYVIETIYSVINQTYQNWEWIIIDDYSNDGTRNILRKVSENDSRIKILYNECRLGAGASRNKGIKIASGNYLTFIDSDDLWDHDRLECHLNFMTTNDLLMSHGSYGFIDANGLKLKRVKKVSKQPIGLHQLLTRTEISCLSTIINIEKIGKFYMSEDIRRQDLYLWISILKSGYKSIGYQTVKAYYRQHNQQPKKNWKFVFDHFRFLKKRIGLSLFESVYYTIQYSLRGFFKYFTVKQQ